MQFNQETPEDVRVFIGGKIREPGAYIGKFERVYEHISNTGSVGLKFEFVSDKGQSANWYLNTIKKDGSLNDIGMSEIQKQIMPLLGLKVLKEKPNDTLSFYDFDLKSDVDRKVTTYPQLFNKRIGVFFKMESSTFNGKDTANARPDFYFDPDTKQTAAEKDGNKPANTMTIKLDRINSIDKAYEKHLERLAESQKPTVMVNSQKTVDDDFEDDIPF